MSNSKQIAYPYKDEQGNLSFKKIRIMHNDGGKSFYFQRVDSEGRIVNNIEGCRKVLYRLPDVLQAIRDGYYIFLVEGEKDADTLFEHEIFATTAPGTLEWDEEYTSLLQKADVVILYDYDKTGVKRRDMLCKLLHGRVNSLRVVDLPGLGYTESHGKDITDWLQAGNTRDQLINLALQTPEYRPTEEDVKENPSDNVRVVSLEKFLELNFPPREMLLAPFLPSQGLVMIYAKRGVGKTHMALCIAYTIAIGDTFLHWQAPKPKKVLYIDGEMPAALMQERLQKIISMFNQKPAQGYFNLITPDMQEIAVPNLSIAEGRNALENHINDCDLIIIDNISCLFRSGNENDSESWQEAQEWALDLRRRGKPFCLYIMREKVVINVEQVSVKIFLILLSF